jgi:hypothetical protein
MLMIISKITLKIQNNLLKIHINKKTKINLRIILKIIKISLIYHHN